MSRIPDDHVAAILKRASELDRQPAALTVDMLRESALEAGIGAAAVDRAVTEYLARHGDVVQQPAAVRPPVSWRGIRARLAQPLLAAFAALGIGLAGAIDERFVVAGVVAWIAASAALVLRDRQHADARGFQFTTAAAASGLFAGFLTAGGGFDGLVGIAATGIVLLLAGTAAIRLDARGSAEPTGNHTA